MFSSESTAATAMIDGLLAGTPTKPGLPKLRFALLPAAATISVPAFRARRPTASYACETARMSAPRDIEITRQPLAIAQLIPARMLL